MRVSYKGAIALAFVVFEISLWSVFLEIGGSSIGILPELFYAFLVGSTVSVSISLAVNRGRGIVSIVKKPNMFVIMIIAGLLNDILTQLFLGAGTLGTNATVGGIVFRSWVILVALLTPIALKQKVKAKQLAATLIGFLGIYIILSGGTLFSFNASQMLPIGLLLIAAGCSTISILIMNRYNVDIIGAIAIFNIVSFIAAAALVIATNTSISVPFSAATFLPILFLGIIAYGVGTMLYYYAVKIFGPLTTGNSILAVPFLTILFSFLIISTPVRGYYIAAAALASIGIILQRRYSSLPERITNKGIVHHPIFDVTGVFVNNKGGEISSYVEGSNRAFAMKLGEQELDEKLYAEVFSKRKCMAFTSANPHMEVSLEEIAYINDLMELGDGESALVGLGDPESLEQSFRELALYG